MLRLRTAIFIFRCQSFSIKIFRDQTKGYLIGIVKETSSSIAAEFFTLYLLYPSAAISPLLLSGMLPVIDQGWKSVAVILQSGTQAAQ